MRLNSDGSLDTSFNLGSGLNGSVSSISLLSTGKMIIGGAFTTVNGVSRGLLARLNTDGSLDASFGGGAGFSSSTASMISFSKSLLDSNGKLYVLGMYDRYDGQVVSGLVRLNADGTLDTGFTPAITVPFGSELGLEGLQLLVATDYQTGTCLASVIRLTTAGAIDSGLSCNDGSLDASVSSILVRNSDGFIWLGGNFQTRRHVTAQRGLARFNTDGTLDTSFVSGFDSSGIFGGVKQILIQTDGKILARGDFTTYGGTARNGLMRINANGTLDATFASSYWSNQINAMVLRSDQKIYVGGSFELGVGFGRLALLNTNGTQDTSFGGLGTDQLLNGDVLALGLASSGNILVGGKFDSLGITPIKPLTSITSAGVVDSNFDWADLNAETEVEVSDIVVTAGQGVWVVGSYAGTYSKYNSSTGLYEDEPTRHFKISRTSEVYGYVYASVDEYTNTLGNTFVDKISVQPDGNILIAGQPWYGYERAVRRYNSDGLPEDAYRTEAFNQQITCLSAESNTSTFISYWGSYLWQSRDVSNSYMTVISP